jgi:hypothetical protein
MESVWDTPVDAAIRELDNIAQLRAEAAAALRPAVKEPEVVTLTMSILLPIIIVFVGLLGLHYYMQTYHPTVLTEAQKARKKRDRAQNRRGRAGPSRFKLPWKMAQAGGAGGRSANS